MTSESYRWIVHLFKRHKSLFMYLWYFIFVWNDDLSILCAMNSFKFSAIFSMIMEWKFSNSLYKTSERESTSCVYSRVLLSSRVYFKIVIVLHLHASPTCFNYVLHLCASTNFFTDLLHLFSSRMCFTYFLYLLKP